MSPDRPDLETALEELARRLNEIERRLVALETRSASSVGDVSGIARGATSDTKASPHEGLQWSERAALIGRILLILAGAFLLRALTESGTLPQVAGTALGLVYALVWLGLAARVERAAAASLYAVATALIAYPLVWEATATFELWSAGGGVAALVVVSAAGLGVAVRRRLHAVAWVHVLFAIATALALAVATKELALFVAPLLLLGLATLWMGYERGWTALGWTAGLVADAAVLGLGLMVLFGSGERIRQILHPESVVALQLALVLIYCASLGARTLSRREDVTPTEVAQGTLVVVVGLGGAVAVALATGWGRTIVGLVSLVCAVACYGAAFAFVDRRTGSRLNFIFYTTLGLVFVLVALEALLAGGPFALVLAALAVLAAWLGAARQRATLTLHGAVYAVVAMVASGTLALAADAFVGATAPAADRLRIAIVVVTLISAICACMPVATHGRTWGGFSRAPKLAFLVVTICGVDAALVVLGARWLPVDSGPVGLAALRTGVLAATALCCGWAGRFPRLMEARWLVYPVLVAGGLKLLAQDVPAGSAAGLVLSFAVYGGALIVAPRLARH